MGEYAIYIWPSYALATAIVLALAIVSLRGLKKAQRQLAELQQDIARIADET